MFRGAIVGPCCQYIRDDYWTMHEILNRSIIRDLQEMPNQDEVFV